MVLWGVAWCYGVWHGAMGCGIVLWGVAWCYGKGMVYLEVAFIRVGIVQFLQSIGSNFLTEHKNLFKEEDLSVFTTEEPSFRPIPYFQ